MGMMDTVVKAMPASKREEMMVNMMPLMMEGIDINELMPKMMENMLKDLTADDIVKFISDLVSDSEKLSEIGAKLADANLMAKMMMKKHKSKLSFEDTVVALEKHAGDNKWHVPDVRDLQKLWEDQGIEYASKIKVLYLCNAEGGAEIVTDENLLPMTTMMPSGMSVYEKKNGDVEIAYMNFGMMAMMFPGKTKEILKDAGDRISKMLEHVI